MSHALRGAPLAVRGLGWEVGEDVDETEPVWHTLGSGGSHDRRALRPRRMLVQLVAGVLLVLVLVTVAGSLAARALAEREAEADAATRAAILADSVVRPALTEDVVAGDRAATAAFDRLIRRQVLVGDVVRVKIWEPTGRVVYADEPQLVGQSFQFDGDQRAALDQGTTQAEISDLAESENAFEGADRLVEVYRPMTLPDGELGLFEVYTSYDPVGERMSTLWRGFTTITAVSVLAVLLLLAPILWTLFDRVRRHERQRTELLERSADASAAERRRVAADLHDGPVQELAATSFAVAGAAARAKRDGAGVQAASLDDAAASVRASIKSLRTLLADIYPTALVDSGLGEALDDLAQTSSTTSVRVAADVEPGAEGLLDAEQQRTVFRLAQESVRNAVKHAGPCDVSLRLARDDGSVTLDVVDDGVGFDVARALRDPDAGHLGLRILGDLAHAPGLSCQVSSRPGAGAHVRVVVDARPRDAAG